MTTQSPPTSPQYRDTGNDDATRMSFGDHLDELRACLIRALLGLVITVALTLYFGRDILDLICRPLLLSQLESGLQPSLQALGPVTAFSAYLKIGFLGGLILAMPWLLYQAWSFVSSGLFPQERRFVRWSIVPSVALFMLGVLFLYFVVLPIILSFFIGFNQQFNIDAIAMTPKTVAPAENLGALTPTTLLPTVPVLPADPPAATIGDAWINTSSLRFVVKTPSGLLSMPMEKGSGSSFMQSQFAIDYYVSFVLSLALAFGIAFETPIVVYCLARTGIVPTQRLIRARRYVLLAIVLAAAILTPPDVISQLLLAGPMYILFELGIFAARLTERRNATKSSA